MKIRMILCGASLIPAVVAGQGVLDRLDQKGSELRKKADAIRATPEETNFKRIPWITDLDEGFRLARLENRPVFLYAIFDEPLDDC